MAESTRSAATATLERYTIAAIPESERHGRPRDLFTIWFSSNIMPLTFVTGALAPVAFQAAVRRSNRGTGPVAGETTQAETENSVLWGLAAHGPYRARVRVGCRRSVRERMHS